MRKSLRVPAALAFVVGTSALAAMSCGDDTPSPSDGPCAQACVPTGTDDSNCPNRTVCVSNTGTCPANCAPEPIV